MASLKSMCCEALEQSIVELTEQQIDWHDRISNTDWMHLLIAVCPWQIGNPSAQSQLGV